MQPVSRPFPSVVFAVFVFLVWFSSLLNTELHPELHLNGNILQPCVCLPSRVLHVEFTISTRAQLHVSFHERLKG